MAARPPAILVVLVTCPNRASARRIGEQVIARRAAACVNIVPGVLSLFWWQGRIERAPEVLLIMKTTAAGFERLRRTVLSLHPYTVPEIIAVRVVAAHLPYHQWVGKNVQARS